MSILFIDSRILPAVGPTATASAASVGALMAQQNVAIRPGTRAKAHDTTLGGIDCIFLPTVASVTSGLIVTFRESASGVFTVGPLPNTANLAAPLAVSLHTGSANNYGWFAVAGTVKVKKTAVKVTPNASLYISATTGRVSGVAASGKQILGMKSSPTATVASATSTVTVTIMYPHAQGSNLY